MTPQEKAWKTRKSNESSGKCVVCHKNNTSSKNSKTCSRSCAAKLAWITGKK